MALYYVQYETASPNTASGAGFVVDPQSMVDANHGVSVGFEGDIPSDFMNQAHAPQYNYNTGTQQLVHK
jgi:hypothetical protein